jgi:hypothetical protein
LSLERLTNNPCENWFDQIKESLRNFIPAMPSDYSNFIYTSIEAYTEEFPDVQSIELKKYQDFNKDSTENWSKGIERIKRDKNFYWENFVNKSEDVFDNFFECI